MNCTYCANEFVRKTINHHYCSKLCKDRAQAVIYGTAYATKNTQKARSKSPERYLKSLLNKKRRAANLTIEDLMDIYNRQNGKCALSGFTMTYILGDGRKTTNISIDRIKAGGPYTKDNVRLVCAVVNTMRWTMDDDELRTWCKRILRNK